MLFVSHSSPRRWPAFTHSSAAGSAIPVQDEKKDGATHVQLDSVLSTKQPVAVVGASG